MVGVITSAVIQIDSAEESGQLGSAVGVARLHWDQQRRTTNTGC
jgi:hypothetical protein